MAGAEAAIGETEAWAERVIAETRDGLERFRTYADAIG